jgi:hypothetical protein
MSDFQLVSVDPILIAIAQRHVEAIKDDDNWHAAVRRVQDMLNVIELAQEITEDLTPHLRDILRAKDIAETELYLRAARPNHSADAIGWHREGMYGGEPELFNVWVPILNVTSDNTIKYIPGSAAISDDAIRVEHVHDSAVERGSDSHRIGLLYAPKRIVGGVDFDSAKPMVVPQYSASVFSGSLIHGAAQNRTEKTRFSVDFRVIAKEHARSDKWRAL